MAGQSPRWIMTARVLRRCGFGATGAEVDAVVGQNWPSYVDAALAADPDADRGALATPMPSLLPPQPPGRGATKAARAQYRRRLSEQNDELTRWWLSRMVAVERPLHEKLTLLWHNHFATSAQKVRIAAYMAAQNQKLRTLKLGDFRTLAYTMLTDAAMLRWLDGQLNTAKAPNENLAREFMELFTLGHNNGYTEDDVRAGARALTGWTIGDGQPVLVARRRDPGLKTLFGVTRDFDAAGFCDAVLARPGSAAHVAGRLWQQLVSDEPPSGPALERVVAAYGPRRDLKALTRAVLTDDEFTGGRATVVNTPVEWLVGVIRALRPAEQHDKLVETTLKVLGQRPFFPTDVNGWPRGQVWLSTASATTRLRTAAKLARSADLSTIDSTAPGQRIDAVGYLIGVGAWTDRTVEALQPLVRQPERLVTAAVNTPEYLTS
ncbi:DUF1800 domain-containing protein [Mycobacterium paragordonae]|uniref:DUF1800 domain-containing protein n=1 Tax=Mycobacterium paragordonae TaxID=1389713 RepID=A0A4R5WQN9_9MYCO|nr:DUF1800 domain-containing protein [Mycobacterium paragordonae]MDP7737236.1 DUF1800 domain-containing protein [Mycobacterium paragordonae]TDK94083.1 DUF1800 domain-containing protein [Mycobacterium paragordonae]TDL05251.1 DUF1800 domain-containing protein [Mycobacterium paragordonae]